MSTITLELHVQPGAKRTEFAGMHGARMKVRLAAPPVDGKANAELIALVAKHFGVPQTAISVISGRSARLKLVRISSAR